MIAKGKTRKRVQQLDDDYPTLFNEHEMRR